MTTLAYMFALPGFDLHTDISSDESLQLTATSTATNGPCPDCAVRSMQIHSYYRRTLADLPCSDRTVRLTLHLRRFYCRNTACARATFVEGVPSLAASYARRTLSLADVQQLLGLALGGEAGARLAERLHMQTSPDTLLRVIRCAPDPPCAAPYALGMDEWAWRKGRRYGTILCDLDTHRTIDLLPDDKAETITGWLRAHPDIAIISRDRAGPVALAATTGAPQATQVADRFHLLQNVAATLKRVFERHRTALGPVRTPCTTQSDAPHPLPTPETVMAHDDRPTEGAASAQSAEALRAVRRTQRQARYAEVQRLRAIGMNLRQIAHRIGMSTKTVRRWLQAEAYPAHPGAKRRGRPYGSQLDAYKPYLVARYQAGCQNACALYREIHAQGYPGSRALVRTFITWVRQLDDTGATIPPIVQQRHSIPDLVFAVLRQPEKRTPAQQHMVAQLKTFGGSIELACDLAQTFAWIVRGQRSGEFTGWLEQVTSSGVPEFHTFVTGLRRDEPAVRAALTLPWSNGIVEGNINRLKLLKRSMYGRANFDVLRKRMLYAA